jgi:hypothetical protein
VEKQQILVFALTLEPMIYHTGGNNANLYAIDAVFFCFGVNVWHK